MPKTIKPMKTKQDNSWVEEFDEKFVNKNGFAGFDCWRGWFSKMTTDDRQIENIKSFIQTEIDKAVEEVLDRVDKDLPKSMDYVENTGLTNNMDIALYNQRKDAWNECVEQQRQKLTQLRQSNNLLGEKK